ncbi:MAG: hypothetical protein OEM23_00875 [Gemmatimonadota bacterium]|nr:hypothetical protein [Gemmatimonadota bacterium]
MSTNTRFCLWAVVAAAATFAACDDGPTEPVRRGTIDAPQEVSGPGPLSFHDDGSSLITLVDEQGPNDEPGQKDISKLASDFGVFGAVSGQIHVNWNWDEVTGFAGANTGDACALLDTDGDGLVNYALCVTIIDDLNDVPVQAWEDLDDDDLKDPDEPFDSPRLFSCSESPATVAIQRCTSRVLINNDATPPAEDPDPEDLYSSCVVTSPSGDDPFDSSFTNGPGDDYPDDVKASCVFDFRDIPETSATLLNVCSYPSHPGSDPSDCIVTPGTSFLLVQKDVGADPDGSFDFALSPAAEDGTGSFAIATSGGSGSSDLLLVNSDNNPYSVTETVPDFWQLTTASCETNSSSTGTFNNTDAVTGVNVSAGQLTICTFTDARIDPPGISVVKTANTTRGWDWTIAKTANDGRDPANQVGDDTDGTTNKLTLQTDEPFVITYEVQVDGSATSWSVSGDITLKNLGQTGTPTEPFVATIQSLADITDVISLGGQADVIATVDCGGPIFPVQLAAQETLVCSYSASLPTGDQRVNTAGVTVDWNSGELDQSYSGTADVIFGFGTSTEIDKCVDVSDSHAEFAAQIGDSQVCANDVLPETFTYTKTVQFGVDQCAQTHNVDNTAGFLAVDDENDTGESGSDSWFIDVMVTCPEGPGECPLTQGYWKTHSEIGPAPTDLEGWSALGDADGDFNVELQGEEFFLSGQTYYEVLWTAPKGNVYYNLAHQYIAAELNIANDVDETEVVLAFSTATEILEACSPADLNGLKGGKTQNCGGTSYARDDITALMEILADFNEGAYAVPECSTDHFTPGGSI